MVIKDDGLVESTSEKSNCDDKPPLKDVRLKIMIWSNRGRTSSILDAYSTIRYVV
jgi:hypothetical protein